MHYFFYLLPRAAFYILFDRSMLSNPTILQKQHQSLSDHDASEGCEGEGRVVFLETQPGIPHPLPRLARAWIPACLRYDDPAVPVEATGLAVDKWAMGPLFMSSIFLGPALLELATKAAGCPYNTNKNNIDDDNATDATEDTICENKVYGFRPSSLLTNMAVVSGLLVPIFLPLVGAIVDHTPYRRQVAAITGIGVALVKGIEIGVGPSTWFFVTILQVTTAVLYNVHVTSTYAYNSELSSLPEKQATYNAFFSMVLYASMLFFLIAVLFTSGVVGADNVQTARISQTITAVTALVLFCFSWKFLFRDRPATAVIRPGQTIVTSGFYKVWESACRIARYYRSLQWVIVSLMFAEAAMSALATIATTFATQVLKMNSNEVGVVFLVVLCMGIPGSWLGGWTTVHLHSPIRSAMACNLFFILVTAAASMSLTGPEHKRSCYIYAGLWGVALGWLSPVDTTMFISIMPKDSRAEFMGIYMLAVSILAWLPPLLFSMLNEAGLSMAWGLASLNIFFLISVFCLSLVGDYQKAVEYAKDGHVQLAVSRDEINDHEIL